MVGPYLWTGICCGCIGLHGRPKRDPEGIKTDLSSANPRLCCDPKECRLTVRRSAAGARGAIYEVSGSKVCMLWPGARFSAITSIAEDMPDATKPAVDW